MRLISEVGREALIDYAHPIVCFMLGEEIQRADVEFIQRRTGEDSELSGSFNWRTENTARRLRLDAMFGDLPAGHPHQHGGDVIAGHRLQVERGDLECPDWESFLLGWWFFVRCEVCGTVALLGPYRRVARDEDPKPAENRIGTSLLNVVGDLEGEPLHISDFEVVE